MNQHGSPIWRPGHVELKAVFEEEVQRLSGRVQDSFENESLLILRAILPRLSGEVRRKDQVTGGVTLFTKLGEVRVHPYTLRQVCKNGAVHAQSEMGGRVARLSGWAPAEAEEGVLEEVRCLVRAAANPAAFAQGLREMRAASAVEADQAMSLLAFLKMRGFGPGMARIFLDFDRVLRRREDRTLFGFMNAITSLARDTRDPETRWRLEELGGAVAALKVPPRPGKVSGARATAVQTS